MENKKKRKDLIVRKKRGKIKMERKDVNNEKWRKKENEKRKRKYVKIKLLKKKSYRVKRE